MDTGRWCGTCGVRDAHRAACGRPFAVVELTMREKPLTLNRERNLHRMQRAQFVRHWREQFGWLGREAKLRPSAWLHVSAIPFQKRGPLQDVSSCHPSVKAAIDGLVDIGIIPDDTTEFVPVITYLPPQRGDDALTLVVECYREE